MGPYSSSIHRSRNYPQTGRLPIKPVRKLKVWQCQPMADKLGTSMKATQLSVTLQKVGISQDGEIRSSSHGQRWIVFLGILSRIITPCLAQASKALVLGFHS